MNATPRIIQSQPASGATQLNAATAAAAPAVGAKTQDFARALNDAGEKPGRKSAVNKADFAPPAGQQLPAAGKQPPAALPPQAAATPQLPPRVKMPLPAGNQDGAPPETGPALAPAVGAAAVGAAAVSAATVGAGAIGAAAAGAAAASPAVNGLVPAMGGTAADADGLVDTNSVALNSAATLTVPLAGQAPTSAARADPGPLNGVLDNKGAPRTAATRTTAGAAKTAESAAASADDDATAASNVRASADTVDTAQTLVAAALAHAADALPPQRFAAGTDAAQVQAAQMQAADSSSPAGGSATSDQQLAQQGSVPPTSSTAILVASQLAARPAAAEAVAEAAAGSAASAAKALSVHAQSSTDAAAGLSQLASTATAATDGAPPAPLKVSADVGSAGFGQDLAAQVSLMVDSNLSSARLQVNPPALGPIEVRIALQDGHAQVWLTSHSALTRDALESSSSNLRDMLSSQGFGQVSVDISHRSFQQDRSAQSQSYDARPMAERNEISASSASPASSVRAALGIVDAYA